MSTDLQELSETELASVIENARKALQTRQDSKRKEGIAKIKELAASIGITVEIVESSKPSSRKGTKVPVKYKDPANPSNQWTGRGVTPRWLQDFLQQGRSLEEFAI